MKLCSDYSSDISQLMKMQKDDTLFISTWNKDEEILQFPITKINEYNKLESSQVNKYFFSDEFLNMKQNIISDNTEFQKHNITATNFAFVSNGTIAAWLCILTILNEKKHITALLLSPIYYIYIEILKQLNIEIYVESAYNIDCDKIDAIIKCKNINLVIINNPLFGTGMCISNKKIINIQSSLSKSDGCLLIDNIYNGLKWNKKISLNDLELYSSLSHYDNFIILESLAKNLFLNGIKHCSIFAHSKWINKLEKNSVYFCGSITAQQYNYIQKLYSKKEHSFIITQLKSNVDYAKNNYILLLSLLAGKNVCLSECKSGVYCLLGIPRNKFYAQNDLLIAIEILQKSNVLTLPHDRYLYINHEYYCFRINLMVGKELLLKTIEILQACFNI